MASFSSLPASCKKWLWFGLFLRLLLIPYSGHPDLFFIFGTPFHLLNDGVFDIYRHLAEYFADPFAALYSYQPLHYFLFGLWSGVTQIFADPEYSVWMRQVIDQFPAILRDSEAAFSFNGAQVRLETLFLWKALYLAADFLILYFILRILPEDKNKESYISWWAGSVAILYSQYLFGQCGIVPVAIIVAGIYLYKTKQSPQWMGLCFAFSVPFKLFSLALLPLPLLLARGWREKVKTAGFILLPLLIIYVPLAAHSGGLVFLRMQGGLGASYSEGIAWGWVLTLSKIFQALGFLAIFYHAAFRHRGNFADVLRYVFISFLLLLCVPLKIHYYAWITPFWFLFFNEKRAYAGIYGVILFLLFFANLSDKQTFIGLLAPLDPDFFMSFPGWMDIAYYFSPSGFHARSAILIIFILTVLVALDQLSILFGCGVRKLSFKREMAPRMRNSRIILAYPALWIFFIAALMAFSHPALNNRFKDYLFTRSANFYYEPQLKIMELPPENSLDQKISLQKGRVKRIGLFLEEPIDASVKIEIFEDRAGVEKSVYARDHDGLQRGWVESVPESYFAGEKTVHFRLTNTAPNPIRISIRKRPPFSGDFKLQAISSVKQASIVDGGILRFNVLEEPLFLHAPGLLLQSIQKTLRQEKKFLIFWLIILVCCGVKTVQYCKRRESKIADRK